MKTNYKRILLKLSGESLMGAQGYGIDPENPLAIGDAAYLRVPPQRAHLFDANGSALPRLA